MPRKRTPSPEQQASDRTIAAGCVQILGPLAVRYPAQLEAALTLLRTFASSKVEAPAARRKSRSAAPAPLPDLVGAARE